MPTAKQIDAILSFLGRFTADAFSVGTWHSSPGQFPWFEFSESVTEFQQALYDNGWISSSFKWPDWQDTAKDYVESPDKIDSADAKTIQKLFTTHVRKERFCEGHLAAMFENGHVMALLRRLKGIRDPVNARTPQATRHEMANKDKSKGNKEPTVSKKEKDQKAAELVLSLGADGGGFSIYRTPLASGGWQFHEEGCSMMVLDDDDGGMEEVWSHSTSKPVQSIQEMLPLKEEHGSWVMFSPISIHPEYRYEVWELVQEIVRNLPDKKKRWWTDRRQKRWERFLRRKVELEPSPKPVKKAEPAKLPKTTKRPKRKAPEPGLFSLFDKEAEDAE